MAPSEKKLKEELKAEVRAVLASDERDELTVNYIRQRVAEKLDLDSDFFKQDEWKTLSKDVIHEAVDQFQESDKETTKPQPVSTTKNGKKNGKKRSSEDASPPAKRAKKEAPAKPVKRGQKKSAPQKKPVSDSDSELSELDESEEEKPTKKGKKAVPPKKQPPKKKAKKEESESEPEPEAKSESESELSDLKSEEEDEPKQPAPRRKSKKTAISDDDEKDEISDAGSTSKDRKAKPAAKSNNHEAAHPKVEPDGSEGADDEKLDSADQPTPVKGEKLKAEEASPGPESETKTGKDEKDGDAQKEAKDEALVDDDSSELSSVIDEPPPKRKRKSKGESGPSKPKSTTTKATKATKELTGDEAEIKKLQGQLVKCGVRKIWGFELKEYGDDTRGKIRHLKNMLNDIGMSGRFSEAKAKEIKERRELMADLEAVQEMNDMWGSSGRGGRASRSKAKASTKVSSKDDDEDEEDEEAKAKPRVSKRMADLAFLGSESESD